MDYKIDQLGIQAGSGGALLVEGSWCCPALPGPLVAATTELRDHAISREQYDQRIAARGPWRLKRKDGPDADGYQRLFCPALGDHPGLMCPLRETSLSPRDGRPKVLAPPQEPPKVCTQTAITIPPDAGARYRQDLPYGSPAWHESLGGEVLFVGGAAGVADQGLGHGPGVYVQPPAIGIFTVRGYCNTAGQGSGGRIVVNVRSRVHGCPKPSARTRSC